MPHDLFYANPLAIYGIFLIPFLFLSILYLFYYRKSMQVREARTKWNRRHLFLSLAIIFATLAWMAPLANGRYAGVPLLSRDGATKSEEIFFVIDASASMAVHDTRLGQSRFQHAVEIADDIVSRLQGQAVSLLAFTSEATLLVPPTHDYLFMRLMLQQVVINEGGVPGTDFSMLGKVLEEKTKKKRGAIVLFSDGGDTSDEVAMVSIGLPVIAIGMGTDKGGEVPIPNWKGDPVHSSLMEGTLRSIAEETKGIYVWANQGSTLEVASRVLQFIENLSSWVETVGKTEHQLPIFVYDHYFQYPLLLSVFFFVLCFARRREKILALFMALFLSRLEASPEEYIQAERYTEAETLTRYELSQPKEPWESAILRAQLGRIFLLQGNLGDAIDIFNQILIQQNISPLLRSKVNQDLAVALVMQNEFDEAHQAVELAKKHLCSVQEIQGYPQCEVDPTLIQLSEVILEREEESRKEPKNPRKLSELDLLIHQLRTISRQKSITSISVQNLGEHPDQKELIKKALLPLKKIGKEPSVLNRYYLLRSIHALEFIALIEEQKPQYMKILQNALLRQKQTNEMAKLFRYEATPQALLTWIKDQQREVQDKGAGFLPAVLQWQETDEQQLCLREPWKTALPLYHEGVREVALATDAIQRLPEGYLQTLAAQKKAIILWQEALDQLENEENVVDQAPAVTADGWTQQIIEMDWQDRKKRTPLRVKQVEKPW